MLLSLALALLASLPAGSPPAGFALPGGRVGPLIAATDDEIDLEELRRTAREELVEGLLELAEWCTKKKVFLQRHQVYEAVLHFDPENSVARRGLGFVRDKEGNWVEKARRIAPRDYDREAAAESPERRAVVAERYRAHFLALLESEDAKLTPAQREEVLGDLLAADPDDPKVHELRGEVKVEGSWVLRETAQGKEGRARLKELVQEGFRSAPPVKEAPPNAKERAFGVEWTAVYASPLARSLGTGTVEEIRRLPDALHAAREVFRKALSIEASYPEDLTIYSLARPGDAARFLEKHPSIDDGYRKFLATLDGSLIQGCGDTANWSEEEHRRLDGLVRQGLTWLFVQGCGVTTEDGWIIEGFGLYLTRELVGTRLTWFVQPSSYLVPADDQALKARLLDTRTNWMAEAQKVFESEHRPHLEFLLGKDVNKLTTEELLYSYVLAAFLIEARPEAIPVLLKAVGAGTSSQQALARALGMELPRIDERARRWLGERR